MNNILLPTERSVTLPALIRKWVYEIAVSDHNFPFELRLHPIIPGVLDLGLNLIEPSFHRIAYLLRIVDGTDELCIDKAPLYLTINLKKLKCQASFPNKKNVITCDLLHLLLTWYKKN